MGKCSGGGSVSTFFWNPLLYPLKMSQQGRNVLFFLPLANNDISSHDSTVFETVDF